MNVQQVGFRHAWPYVMNVGSDSENFAVFRRSVCGCARRRYSAPDEQG